MNRALALKLIWKIHNSNSLWSHWIKCYLIRNESFWSTPLKSTRGCWLWHKLLKMRHLAASFYRVNIGNGLSTSFWYDSWTSLGPLIELTGPTGSIALGVPLNTSVAHAANIIRRRTYRSATFNEITEMAISRLSTINLSSKDIPLWKHKEGEYKPTFNTQTTWELIRETSPPVQWYKGIWFKHNTPKFSFISWLAALDRLSTGDRIAGWVTQSQTMCTLCSSSLETRNHIFFDCPYSSEVLRSTFGRLKEGPFSPVWNEVLSLLTSGGCSSLQTFLLRYSFQTALYNIWRERNNRRKGESPTATHQLIRMIDKQIRNRLSSLRQIDGPIGSKGLSFWFSTRI